MGFTGSGQTKTWQSLPHKDKGGNRQRCFFSTGQFNAFALIRHHCTAPSPLTVAPGGNTQTLWTSFGGIKFLLLHEGVNPNMRCSVKGSCAPICSHSVKHPRQLGLSYEGVKHLNKIWIFQLHFKTHNKYFFLGEVIWYKSYINCGLTELYCREKELIKRVCLIPAMRNFMQNGHITRIMNLSQNYK